MCFVKCVIFFSKAQLCFGSHILRSYFCPLSPVQVSYHFLLVCDFSAEKSGKIGVSISFLSSFSLDVLESALFFENFFIDY